MQEAVPGPVYTDSSGRDNLQQLIQLRWIAVIGQIITIGVVHYGLNIRLPLRQMGAVLACLIGFNMASLWRRRVALEISNGELFFALLVDVAMLTAQLYLSGGATNPFSSLYLLQVILGAVLLRAWSVWTMVAFASACFVGLTRFHLPLALPNHPGDPFQPFVEGTLLCFVLNAALLVIFISRISRNLRARDARLADLRERAAEEEHIVRMGLLASGAAHELGTPLSTVSVILGDWRRMPAFSGDDDLLEEIDEMQAQLKRCKTILSGVLMSAGEARGESSGQTTIRTFLGSLVAEWQTTRSPWDLRYDNRFDGDLRIASDSTLKQMIYNLLDNALEASPEKLSFIVTREHDDLVLTVTDEGPGFTPQMLAQFGKPYQSTKGRPGAGLGLFLVTNVARTLKGRVAARNSPHGGAIVTLTLPLESIALDGEVPRGN